MDSQAAIVRRSVKGVDASDQVGDAVIPEACTFVRRPALPHRCVDRHARSVTRRRAFLYVLQMQYGSQGGMYDRNASLLDAASSPSNIFKEALNGDAMAMGVISSSLIVLIAYRKLIFRRVQSAWRALNNEVNQHMMVMILLGFIWWCVAKASGLSEPSMMIQQQRTMLPDVADRLVARVFSIGARQHSTGSFGQ